MSIRGRLRQLGVVLALTLAMTTLGSFASATPAEASVCYKGYATYGSSTFGWTTKRCVVTTGWSQAGAGFDQHFWIGSAGAGVWVPLPIVY